MKKNLIIVLISILVLILVGTIMYFTQDTTEDEAEISINNYLSDLGYSYNEETSMYQKISSNNTLDSFYTCVDNKQDCIYQEYYYSLKSNSFIELYMLYNDEVTETYNITSDLINDTITYNYEITKGAADAIVEGSYDEDKSISFTCTAVSLKKLNEDGVDEYCNTAKNNTIKFLEEENQLLSNQEFINNINVPKKEIIIKD